MADTERTSFLTDNLAWMQKTDILVGLGVIAVVTMLIIPIPRFCWIFSSPSV